MGFLEDVGMAFSLAIMLFALGSVFGQAVDFLSHLGDFFMASVGALASIGILVSLSDLNED